MVYPCSEPSTLIMKYEYICYDIVQVHSYCSLYPFGSHDFKDQIGATSSFHITVAILDLYRPLLNLQDEGPEE